MLSGDGRRDSRLWLAAAGVHLVGLLLYLEWREVLFNPPVAETDYATHWAEVWNVSHFLETGRLWGYDPLFMAGQPAGTLFDVDNKLIEVGSWALNQAGFPLALSYNLVLMGLMFFAPLSLYPAARWLGLGPAPALAGQTAGLALWYLDPALRWSWQGGTLAFASAVCLSLLVLTAGSRLTRPGSAPSRAALATWFFLGPLLFWLHALSFGLLAIPVSVLALARWRSLAGWQRLALAAWPAAVLLANAPWVATAWRFRGDLTASDQFLQGGVPALAADLLGRGRVGGASTVSLLGLRWLVLVVGGIGLTHRLPTDAGWRAVAAGAWVGLGLAYLGLCLPEGGRLQPYRFVEQAALWSTIGLAPGLKALRQGVRRLAAERSRLRAAMTGGLVAGALLWAMPAAVRFRPPAFGGPAEHRRQGPSAAAQAVCAHLGGLALEQGRVLTDDFRLGALLPACSGSQVIGGPFLYVWTRYGFANADMFQMFGVAYEGMEVETWQALLGHYRVRWLVLHDEWGQGEWFTATDWLANHPAEAAAGPRFGPYRLYELPADEAAGTVEAAPDRLTVTGWPATGPHLLPYHWVPGLEAVPPAVQIAPELWGADPAPFIRVQPNGHAGYAICLHDACD